MLEGGQKVQSQVSSYQMPVVLGVAPVYWATVPGKESDGAEVYASVYW